MNLTTITALCALLLLLMLTLPNWTCGVDVISERSGRVERAIGGQRVSLGQWPWLALLRATIWNRRILNFIPVGHYHIYCGGVLITDRWLLSAAHCFTSAGSPSRNPGNWEARLATVRLRANMKRRLLDIIGRIFGQNSLRNWEVDVDRIVIHPAYNTTGLLSNDIALVRLSRSVPAGRSFSYIQSMSLPDPSNTAFPGPGQTCYTKGWGCTSHGGGPSTHAQQIEMPVSAPWRCQRYYNINSMDKRICAGYNDRGVGVCRGDSGSPLVCERDGGYELAGLVSFTSQNNPESFPAVFTRVADYVPWIRSVIEA